VAHEPPASADRQETFGDCRVRFIGISALAEGRQASG
jgi:hypothetical protein